MIFLEAQNVNFVPINEEVLPFCGQGEFVREVGLWGVVFEVCVDEDTGRLVATPTCGPGFVLTTRAREVRYVREDGRRVEVSSADPPVYFCVNPQDYQPLGGQENGDVFAHLHGKDDE